MAMSAEEVVAAIKSMERTQIGIRVNTEMYKEFTKINKSLGITNSDCFNELMVDFVRNYNPKDNKGK